MPGTTTSSSVFFYAYVLLSLKDGEKYIGYTPDLKRRMEEHRQGRTFSTSYRLPVKLIYYEACLSEIDAKRRERYFKSTGGRRFLAKRLRNYFTKL